MRRNRFASIIRCSISPLPLYGVSSFDAFRKMTAVPIIMSNSSFSCRFSSNASDNYRINNGNSTGSKTHSNSLIKTKKVSNFIAGQKGGRSEDDTFTEEIEQEQKLSGTF